MINICFTLPSFDISVTELSSTIVLKQLDYCTMEIYGTYKSSGHLVASSLRSGRYSPGAFVFLNPIDFNVT